MRYSEANLFFQKNEKDKRLKEKVQTFINKYKKNLFTLYHKNMNIYLSLS